MTPELEKELRERPLTHYSRDTLQILLAEIDKLRSSLAKKETELSDAKDDLLRLDAACWYCLNPEVEDAWRHDHGGDRQFHWHHCLDPGDGLADKCKHSEMFERIWQEAQTELRAENERLRSELAGKTALYAAHRACIGAEHGPANGKIHGYCVVCGVPWPCSYAEPSKRIEELEQQLRTVRDFIKRHEWTYVTDEQAIADIDKVLTEETPSSPSTSPEQALTEIAGSQIRIGLRQQGHMPTVEAMLAEGKTWDEIGAAIGWNGASALKWYEMEKQQPSTSPEKAL